MTRAFSRSGLIVTLTISLPKVPVSESLLGINYVNQYLARLAAENSLLTRLPQGEVRAVLERSCPDWRGLLVNLYAPVAANALARTPSAGRG